MAGRTGSPAKKTRIAKRLKKDSLIYQAPPNAPKITDLKKKPLQLIKQVCKHFIKIVLHLSLNLWLSFALLLALVGQFFSSSLTFAFRALGYLLFKPHLTRPRFYFPPSKPQVFPLPSYRAPVFALFLVLPSLLLFGLVITYFYAAVIKDLPNPQKLTEQGPIATTKIFDRNGELLFKIYKGQNRSPVNLEQVPLHLRRATIAIEDAEFYRHHGFSLRGIGRSIYRNLFLNKLSGGSTITQQLVKNTLLTPERTWTRKIKEAFLALWVENTFTKDEILEMYLNQVSYGGSAYGVEEASQLYFGKSVKEITLAEAALLAGLPAAPTTFSPFGAQPELAKKRQETVLRRMLENGFLQQREFEQAMAIKLQYAPQATNILAPHFVMYVRDLLVERYGERTVETGGLEVVTSLDLSLQHEAEKIVVEEVNKIRRLNIGNGAVLITQPKTGEVLAMVGSKDYFDLTNSGNYNVATALRQPGSAIKPINYAAALANNFTAASILSDTPITYYEPNQPSYSPINYDNRYHGNVPLRVALGSSYNIPAVKVLAAIGVDKMIEQGKKMGITTWEERSRFGLSLTLGGGDIKMVDMAVVYGTLANQGLRIDLHPILQVKDYRGKVLGKIDPSRWDVEQREKRVLSPQIAYILTDILSDNEARTPTFGPNSQLVIPNKSVAVKTGTTNNLKDNWTIGYTPSVLVAVWVGNNDASPMSYVASGVTGASPIWNRTMKFLLKGKADEPFVAPPNLLRLEICPWTGTLPCSGCPTRWEWFIPGTEPQTHCAPEFFSPSPNPIP